MQEDSALDPGDPLQDIDKKSSESSFDSDDGPPLSDGAGPPYVRTAKTSKQLQTVVKSFGSLGRSMSKRIRKNLKPLSRLSRAGSLRRKNLLLTKGGFEGLKAGKGLHVGTQQSFILGAQIHTGEREPYQRVMIENYLTGARERFMRNAPKPTKEATSAPPSPTMGQTLVQCDARGTQCINPGCNLYGTAQTSYLCSSCFNRQKEGEEKAYASQLSESRGEDAANSTVGSGLQYGTGRSKFYAPLDENAIRSATLLPVTTPVSSQRDRTLFLSNSTFYNDSALTIPSYNLNRDLSRDAKKTKPPAVPSKTLSEASINSGGRSSSSLSDPFQTNRLGQDRGALVLSKKDSLAPICIDGGKVSLEKRTRAHKDLRGSSKEAIGCYSTLVDVNYCSSKPCQTKGCEFYGNSSTNYFCSKCYLSKKKSSSEQEITHSLDQVKYVQL